MKIKVKVKPNARENSLKPLENSNFEAKVSVPPKKGKANEKVIELLAKYFNLPKSKIRLVSGETYREKVFKISQ